MRRLIIVIVYCPLSNVLSAGLSEYGFSPGSG